MESRTIKELKSACYYADTSIGNFSSFFSAISFDTYKNNKYKKILQQDLDKILYIHNDLAFMSNIESFYDHEGYKKNYYIILNEAKKLFNMELDIPLYLVDRLIEPYNSRDCDGVSIDMQDAKKLNIPHGIYYVKKYLTHVYFEFVVAHELIHQIISENSEYQPYASLNEEGFCDLFCLILLEKTGLFDDTVIKNILLYNRILSDTNSIWYYYWKSFEQACYYSLNNGIKGAINLIKEGRKAIDTMIVDNQKNITQRDDTSILINKYLLASLYYNIPIEEYACLDSLMKGKQVDKFISPKVLATLNEKGLLTLQNQQVVLQKTTFYNYMRYKI